MIIWIFSISWKKITEADNRVANVQNNTARRRGVIFMQKNDIAINFFFSILHIFIIMINEINCGHMGHPDDHTLK